MDIIFGFGNGSFTQPEWEYIQSECKKHNVKNIVEIGSGFSTLCFMNIAKKLDSFETENIFIEALITIIDPDIVTLYKYTYPHLPKEWNQKYDIAFVDGPGKWNVNGRRESMIFAKSVSDMIFIHDFSRANEAESRKIVFPENEWEIVGNKKSTIFIKRKI